MRSSTGLLGYSAGGVSHLPTKGVTMSAEYMHIGIPVINKKPNIE